MHIKAAHAKFFSSVPGYLKNAGITWISDTILFFLLPLHYCKFSYILIRDVGLRPFMFPSCPAGEKAKRNRKKKSGHFGPRIGVNSIAGISKDSG